MSFAALLQNVSERHLFRLYLLGCPQLEERMIDVSSTHRTYCTPKMAKTMGAVRRSWCVNKDRSSKMRLNLQGMTWVMQYGNSTVFFLGCVEIIPSHWKDVAEDLTPSARPHSICPWHRRIATAGTLMNRKSRIAGQITWRSFTWLQTLYRSSIEVH